MNKLHCLGFLLFIIFISCKKNVDDIGNKVCSSSNGISNIDSPDLQNCMYKTGTYWIYIDSMDYSIDSTVITEFIHDYISDVCSNQYETHSFKTKSYPSETLTDYVVVPGGLFKDYYGSVNSGYRIYDDYYSTSSMTNYSPKQLDSVFIFNQYYKNVLQVEIETDKTENDKKSIYYINSEYGFLRHDLYSDNVLVSQKILKDKKIIR